VSSSPRVYDIQLRVAAANTASASSFIANLDLTFASASSESLPELSPPVSEHTVIRLQGTFYYQAPNRIQIRESFSSPGTGKFTIRETQIGGSCWRSYQSTPARGGGLGCDKNAVPNVLSFLSQLERASDVNFRDGGYYLSRRDGVAFVQAAIPGLLSQDGFFGVATQDLVMETRIKGSTISWQRLSFSGPVTGTPSFAQINASLDLVVRYSDIGSAPAVVRPGGPPTNSAASQVPPPATTLAHYE